MIFKRFIEIFEQIMPNQKYPIIDDNTFIVWEPCSKSHSEVVPGFVKYLTDLGYHVSVVVEPNRLKEGLFARFDLQNVTYNKINGKNIRKFFKNADLSHIKGILVTTAGKICDCVNYSQCYDCFNESLDKSKLHIVEHDIQASVDANMWNEKVITLRKMNYKGAKSVVVNPHYFGNVKINEKNSEITNFITIGALRAFRKNTDNIINAVSELHKKGIKNFRVTVVGKGKLKDLPKELRCYFDIKGRLSFSEMYNEIEKSDFILTSYDEDNTAHQRYNTTGTSGNFQLVYGFLKPCLIINSFAEINGFTDKNSILYSNNNEYATAMQKAISMNSNEYNDMQNNLKNYVSNLYNESLNNLKGAINE